jgi:uncharacterized membrane protein YphA (DoxX/SURF4 family)
MNFSLWIAQAFLAASLIWAGVIKLFQPIEKLSAMFPWTGQVSVTLVKCTGLIDLLIAVGLIVPPLLRIQPLLTPVAAIGLFALMICAIIFHLSRGEASVIWVNIIFALLAAFVAWGRFVSQGRV